MDIPLSSSFDVPEGQYRATLYSVTPYQGDGIRIVFNNLTPLSGFQDYKAGKNYRAKDGRKLADDLASWLGKDFNDLVRSKGRSLTAKDLERFLGRDTDIEVEHIDNPNHAEPYKFVKRITPPGTLVPDEYLEEEA